MFKKNTKEKKTNLENEIDAIIDDLSEMDEGTEEYQRAVDNLKKLVALNDRIKKSGKEKVSKDTIAIVAGNLLGILLILNFEKANVITSKALGFILKGRI